MNPPPPLTRESVRTASLELASRDPALRRVVETYGPPPLWSRRAGFPTLAHIILEQQVSLASARAAFDNLRQRLNPLTPAAFLTLGDAELKRIGFSRQKTRYCRELARAVQEGSLGFAALGRAQDDEVRERLTALPGIGPWTANIYLLMVLRRPDIWPPGDIALAQAVKEVKGLPVRPKDDDLTRMARRWRPWRAVAARILWHHYLSVRGRS